VESELAKVVKERDQFHSELVSLRMEATSSKNKVN
jgi:hypothetical protein